MSWKDWLYIPKSDKVAIVVLLAIIVSLLAIYALSNRGTEEYAVKIPDDYLLWQAQIVESKEVETLTNLEKQSTYRHTYQPKMKLGETLELNSADTTLLKTIPGIGSGYANRIVKYRTALGGFANIEQLNEVWGLDTYLYSQVVPYITLSAAHDSIYINTASFQELLAHPYLNYKQVQVITDIRERKGAIRTIKRLALLEEFKNRDLERLALYTSFRQKQ